MDHYRTSEGDGYDDAYSNVDGEAYGNQDSTRDFFSQQHSSSGGYGEFGYGAPYAGSSSFSAPRTGMAALDLNSHGEQWPDLEAYEGILRSPLQLPEEGAGRGSGGRTLGLRVPRGGGVGRDVGLPRGGGAGRGLGVPPGPGGRRGGGRPTSSLPPLPAADRHRRRSGSAGGSNSRMGPPREPVNRGDQDNSGHASSDGDDLEMLDEPPAQGAKGRADWSEANTGIFCDIWCQQIELGNCPNGSMNKSGMKEVIKRYHAATGLRHIRAQFASRIRQLKGLWQLIKDSRTDTGLGCQPDGTVIADDEWWERKTKSNPEWKKYKSGWPEYTDQLEMMFVGVAVDGSTRLMPPEDSGDEQYMHTPSSSNTNKRSSATVSTTSSPSKKPKNKNPAIRTMDKMMTEQNQLVAERNALLRSHIDGQKDIAIAVEERKAAKVLEVQRMAKECGVTAKDMRLWMTVRKITKSEEDMAFFIGTDPEDRKALIEYLASMDD